MQIGPAGPDDLDALVPLFDGYRQFYGRTADRPGARAFLAERMARGDSAVLLARDAGWTAAGFAQLYPSFSSTRMARIYILNDLYVAPPARRRGVGSSLLQAATDWARAAGAIRLTLATALDNRAAQALYESRGWARDTAFHVYNRPLVA